MPSPLAEIASQVKDGGSPKESVRSLLRRFGFERRGYHRVREVRQALAKAGLRTEPDFNSVPLDAWVTFEPKQEEQPAGLSERQPDNGSPEAADDNSDELAFAAADPTYRMSRLEEANQVLLYVRPDDDLRRATTLMMSHDFSQLPVMTSAHVLKGIISWKTLAMRYVLTGAPGAVGDVMESEVTTVDAHASLFAAIPRIIDSDYALVRRPDGTYWIITTADLSARFRELAEPFLLLAEIENQLRLLLDQHLDKSTLRSARDPSDTDRDVRSAADLSLGEIQRLLETPDAWQRVAPSLDRVEVTKQLDALREIRNDVMHFDPEGVGPSDLQMLRTFARFLREFSRE